jgi:hypothetical protein
VDQVPGRVLGELHSQRVGNLLGTPPLIQPPLNLVLQDRVAGQPALLGADQTPKSYPVHIERPITPGLVTVPAHLPADRRCWAPELATDGPQARTGPAPVSDQDPLEPDEQTSRKAPEPWGCSIKVALGEW